MLLCAYIHNSRMLLLLATPALPSSASQLPSPSTCTTREDLQAALLTSRKHRFACSIQDAQFCLLAPAVCTFDTTLHNELCFSCSAYSHSLQGLREPQAGKHGDTAAALTHKHEMLQACTLSAQAHKHGVIHTSMHPRSLLYWYHASWSSLRLDPPL